MIIVIGTAISTPGTHDEMLRLSLEHVARSREEPGCIAHNVHVDSEDATRLVFVEYWEHRSALLAHFALSESRRFAKAMGDLAAAAPEIRIFDAQDMPLG